MFSALQSPKLDQLVSLMEAANADFRSCKVDVALGVYRDAKGETPIMEAVREAEKLLAVNLKSKTYVGPLGDPEFMHHMQELTFPGNHRSKFIKGVQTPGGSGGFRLLLDLVKLANPNAKVWISDPTYTNHLPTIEAVGLAVGSYPFLDRETMTLKKDEMLSFFNDLGTEDVVLLHGSCHNPSGVKLKPEDWLDVAEIAQSRGFLPLVDTAYQGLDEGVVGDAKGLSILVDRLERVLVCVSCSKNFALYNDRTGCAFVVGESQEEVNVAQMQLADLAQPIYWVPPNNGASIVKTILSTPELKKMWVEELGSMNSRLKMLRHNLADSLRKHSSSDRFDFILSHGGMFSMLPASEVQMQLLREEYAIYGLNDGRISIAGLPEDKIDYVAESVVAVVGAE